MIEWACPICGAQLVYRQGVHGYFLGCSSYPKCKGNKNLEVLKEYYIDEAMRQAHKAYANDSLYLRVSRCDIDAVNIGRVSTLFDSCLNNMDCHIRVVYNMNSTRYSVELIT